MRYKLLGRSGLRVSELCLGTMTFGEEWGFGSGAEGSRQVFDRYVEAGGNFLDTANKYTEGTSERLLGEFVASERDRYVIATKYTLAMDPDDPNASGNHRKNMRRSLEASLARLGTDHVDLYWVHAWDFFTPLDEILRGLDDLVRAGKVLYVGISDTPAWRVAQANTLADLKGWSPFVALQIKYSLIDRTAERDLLPMAKALDLAVTPWGMLESGLLTGKYGSGKVPQDAGRAPFLEGSLTERNLKIADEVVGIANELGATPAQIAQGWVRQRQDQAQILPILGVRTRDQLDDALGLLDVTIPEAAMARLDAASTVDLGFPHEFLRSGARPYVYGNTFDLIDDHRPGR